MAEFEVFNGMVESGCPEIPDNSCDLVVTSPPYFMRDGYTDDLMLELGSVIGRVLKPGARAYMVFGQISEGIDRPIEAQQLVKQGSTELLAGQTIIWVKSIVSGGWVESCGKCSSAIAVPELSRGHFQPINSNRLLNYCWEYVFSFVKKPKSKAVKLDRKAIGVPYSDKSNLKRWGSASDDLHCPGDAWFIPYSTTGAKTKKSHRHEYPEELVDRIITMNRASGGIIFDPFLGGGTTLRVGARRGMYCYGYDIDKDAVNSAANYLAELYSVQQDGHAGL